MLHNSERPEIISTLANHSKYSLPLLAVLAFFGLKIDSALACTEFQKQIFPVDCAKKVARPSVGAGERGQIGRAMPAVRTPSVTPPDGYVRRVPTPEREAMLHVPVEKAPVLPRLDEDIASIEARTRLAPALARFASTWQNVTSTDERGRRHSYSGYPRSVPSLDNPDHFYGAYGGINIPGTFINQHLNTFLESGQIPRTIEDTRLVFKVDKIQGRTFLVVYVNGQIDTLTYVSLGTEANPTNIKRTIVKTKGSDLRLYPNKISAQAKGSSMFMAIEISGGIMYHRSGLGINGLGRSHGCVRTPMKYLDRMHQLLDALQEGEQVVMEFRHLS